MTIASTLQWIESTQLSLAIREGGLPYPIIGGVHLLSIALFGGTLLAVDLRLLGWLMPYRRFSEVWHLCQPWKRLGFVVVMGTGLLLAWAEPVRLWDSPAFWVKMSLLALVGVHALAFRGNVYGHPEKLDATISSQAKLAAVLSLTLWAGMVLSGRLIAYSESFEPKSVPEQPPTVSGQRWRNQGDSRVTRRGLAGQEETHRQQPRGKAGTGNAIPAKAAGNANPVPVLRTIHEFRRVEND